MTGSQDAARADAAVAAVEQQMSALFNRVRSSWKDQAVAVHPDLQPVGFKILAQLVRGGPSHAGVLADLLQTDKSIVSRQVRIMEGLGLVESREDPADGRARVLAATPLALEKVNAHPYRQPGAARATAAQLADRGRRKVRRAHLAVDHLA